MNTQSEKSKVKTVSPIVKSDKPSKRKRKSKIIVADVVGSMTRSIHGEDSSELTSRCIDTDLSDVTDKNLELETKAPKKKLKVPTIESKVQSVLSAFHCESARQVMLTWSPSIADEVILDEQTMNAFQECVMGKLGADFSVVFGIEGDLVYTSHRLAMVQGNTDKACAVCGLAVTTESSTDHTYYLPCECFLHRTCVTDSNKAVVSCSCGTQHTVLSLMSDKSMDDLDGDCGGQYPEWGDPHFGKLRHCHVLIARRKDPNSRSAVLVRRSSFWSSLVKTVLTFVNDISAGLDLRPVSGNMGRAYICKGGNCKYINFDERERAALHKSVTNGLQMKRNSLKESQALNLAAEKLGIDTSSLRIGLQMIDKERMFEWMKPLLVELGVVVIRKERYVKSKRVVGYGFITMVEDTHTGLTTYQDVNGELEHTIENRWMLLMDPVMKASIHSSKRSVGPKVIEDFKMRWEKFIREICNGTYKFLFQIAAEVNKNQIEFADGVYVWFSVDGVKVYNQTPVGWCPVLRVNRPFRDVINWQSDDLRNCRSYFGYQCWDKSLIEFMIIQNFIPPCGKRQSFCFYGHGGDGKSNLLSVLRKYHGCFAVQVKASSSKGAGFGAMILGKDVVEFDEAKFTEASMVDRLKDVGDASVPSSINVPYAGIQPIQPLVGYAASNPANALPGIFPPNWKSRKDGVAFDRKNSVMYMPTPDASVIRRFWPIRFRQPPSKPHFQPFELNSIDTGFAAQFSGEAGALITHLVQQFVLAGPDRLDTLSRALRGRGHLYYSDRMDVAPMVLKGSRVMMNPYTQRIVQNYKRIETNFSPDVFNCNAEDSIIEDKDGVLWFKYRKQDDWNNCRESIEDSEVKFKLRDGPRETLGWDDNSKKHTKQVKAMISLQYTSVGLNDSSSDEVSE